MAIIAKPSNLFSCRVKHSLTSHLPIEARLIVLSFGCFPSNLGQSRVA